MAVTHQDHDDAAGKAASTKKTSASKNDDAENKYKRYQNNLMGSVLILLGVAGFVTTAIYSLIDIEKVTNGTIPAVSFVTLIIGLAFYFPTLLEEDKNEISTMRVVVLIVVLVFAAVYIKLGWVAGGFEEFIIDTSWIYILGLAFGAKAVQKFAEEEEDSRKKNGKKADDEG